MPDLYNKCSRYSRTKVLHDWIDQPGKKAVSLCGVAKAWPHELIEADGRRCQHCDRRSNE